MHHEPPDDRLREPARQNGRLLYPSRYLRLIEIVFVDVNPPSFLAGASRGNRAQRSSAEEGYFHIACENVERHEPTLALDSIERRVPFHGFAHTGSVAHDERVETLPDVALPGRHR